MLTKTGRDDGPDGEPDEDEDDTPLPRSAKPEADGGDESTQMRTMGAPQGAMGPQVGNPAMGGAPPAWGAGGQQWGGGGQQGPGPNWGALAQRFGGGMPQGAPQAMGGPQQAMGRPQMQMGAGPQHGGWMQQIAQALAAKRQQMQGGMGGMGRPQMPMQGSPGLWAGPPRR